MPPCRRNICKDACLPDSSLPAKGECSHHVMHQNTWVGNCHICSSFPHSNNCAHHTFIVLGRDLLNATSHIRSSCQFWKPPVFQRGLHNAISGFGSREGRACTFWCGNLFTDLLRTNRNSEKLMDAQAFYLAPVSPVLRAKESPVVETMKG